MLVVKVELHSARTGNVETLGVMLIDNVSGHGQGADDPRADYRVRVGRKGSTLVQAASSPLRTGEVWNYPRLRYNVWRLVSRALRSAFPEEK